MILKYPVSTEKTLQLVHKENKLVFIVDVKATKRAIKEEAERLFKAGVVGVNTLITPAGKKRAVITFSKETPAIDVATKLGIM